MSDDGPEKLSRFIWRRPVPEKWAGGFQYLHWCPACKCGHTYHVGSTGRPSWTFNGNAERPSFSPSMLIFMPAGEYGGVQKPQRTICHYFLTDGQLQYQTDSPHELSGKTVPLPPIPDDYGF